MDIRSVPFKSLPTDVFFWFSRLWDISAWTFQTASTSGRLRASSVMKRHLFSHEVH